MLPSDLSVQVRDITLARQGVIKPSDLNLSATLIVRDVGSWKITLPKDHAMVPILATPGSGIIVDHRPSGVRLFSGPTEVPSNLQNAANPDGTYTFTGLTDTVILRDALAWPDPTGSADPNAQTKANDDRTATHAETLMRAYVSDNIGPTAPAGRRGLLAQHLTIAANGNRGPAAQASPRFTNLLELEQDLGLFAGLGFQVIQRGSSLVFEVLTLTDRSGLILLDINSGTISSQQATVSPPTITRAIVAGGGEGTDRVMVQRTTTDSTAAEGDWGRVIEEFIDQRQTSDTGELAQKGDAELAASGYTAIAIKIVASDDTTMIYGTDWREGDVVRINYNGEPRSTLVTAAAIIANSSRTVIGMSIGDTSQMTPAGRSAAATNSNTSDVKALQANAEPTPLPTALTTDAGQDAIVFWDDSASALGQATLDATLVMTGTVLAVRAATAAVTGVVQLASDAEAITGTDPNKAVPPHALAAALAAALATLIPPGVLMPAALPTAPSGWLLCDGSAVSRTTYANLFAALNPTIGTVTMTIAAPAVVTKTAHGLQTGQMVYLTTTGALPTGLAANTAYFVVRIDANTFNLATTLANALAGTKITTTGSQSGTHTLRTTFGVGNGSSTFNVPNAKGATLVGVDSGQTEFAALGQTGGEKAHTLTGAETPNLPINIRRFDGDANDYLGGSGNAYGIATPYTTGGTEYNISQTGGGGGAHNNLQPYVALNYIIKT